MGVGGACWEYANGQKIYVYEKNDARGLSAPAQVYDHNIQISSSLKWLVLLKANFMWSILRKGELKFI